MVITKIDNFSDEELKNIIMLSSSYTDLARRLGYLSCSSNTKKSILKHLQGYDLSHLEKAKYQPIPRDDNKDIFITNSQVGQSVLRTHYLKLFPMEKCAICGQSTTWNNKPLTLILDHIDGINNNNTITNLRWVCPNCNMQLPTTGSKNQVFQRKSKKHQYYCIDCGKEITSPKSPRCIECAIKFRTRSIEEMPITRQELKDLIRSIPFTHIGKQFGVTDNAIKKWCDKFDLPRTKQEILSYSDEEWLKI